MSNAAASDGLSLLPDERAIRTDLVLFSSLTGRWWPDVPQGRRYALGAMWLADMTLTDRRLIFTTPKLSRRLHNWITTHFLPILSLGLLLALPLLPDQQDFDLAAITLFRTWDRTFAGPIVFQIGTDGWSFRPVARAFPLRFAPRQRMKEQFAEIEPAWVRAGQGDASAPVP